jgi:hypothetical protein
MTFRFALVFLFVTLSVSGIYAQEGPNRPEAKPVTLDSKTTVVLELDLSARCHDPKQVCSKIIGPVADFLERRELPVFPSSIQSLPLRRELLWARSHHP